MNSIAQKWTQIAMHTILLKLCLLVILCNPLNLNICHRIPFIFWSKTCLTNILTSRLFFAHSTDNVAVFILLPYTMMILSFTEFFLTNFTIIATNVCGYSSIYGRIVNVVTSCITTNAYYVTNFLMTSQCNFSHLCLYQNIQNGFLNYLTENDKFSK